MSASLVLGPDFPSCPPTLLQPQMTCSSRWDRSTSDACVSGLLSSATLLEGSVLGLWRGTAARLTSPSLGQLPSSGFWPTSWWLVGTSWAVQLSQPDLARPAEPPLLPEHMQVHGPRPHWDLGWCVVERVNLCRRSWIPELYWVAGPDLKTFVHKDVGRVFRYSSSE